MRARTGKINPPDLELDNFRRFSPIFPALPGEISPAAGVRRPVSGYAGDREGFRVPNAVSNRFWSAVAGLVLLAPGSILAADGDAASARQVAGRRDATLKYYAFHLAKLDANVSFCDGERTGYRPKFEEVVAASGTAIPSKVMKSYDDRYDTFAAGLGGYDCPEVEVTHYRGRLPRQIKNLKRDLKALR